MSNPTISAGYPKALLDFAVSRGADRQTLIARAHIHPEELQNQDNRIPLANYLAMLHAGIELCNEPALALLFGEAVKLADISIVGMMGQLAGNSEEGRRQMGRYGRLALDEDEGDPAELMKIVRDGSDLWLRSTSRLYVENPHLTESAFARWRLRCAGDDWRHAQPGEHALSESHPLHAQRAGLPRRIRPDLRRSARLRESHECNRG
jgi:hypothetical protein